MGFRIEDGAGTGVEARVNAKHRLEVNAAMNDPESVATDEEKSYVLYASCNLAVTAVKSGLLYIKNTGSEHIHITRMCFCTENIGVNGVYVQMLKNPTPSTVAAEVGVEVSPINKNFASGKSANVAAFIADTTDLEFSVLGSIYHKFWLNEKSIYDLDVRGSNELLQGNVLGFRWLATQLGSPTNATKINLAINYFLTEASVS